MESLTCKCKMCDREPDWFCVDYEFYCDEHAPINRFQKIIGYIFSYLLLIEAYIKPKY